MNTVEVITKICIGFLERNLRWVSGKKKVKSVFSELWIAHLWWLRGVGVGRKEGERYVQLA